MTTNTCCFCSQIRNLYAFEDSKCAALSEWKSRHAGKKKPRPIDIYDANQCEVNPPPDAQASKTTNGEILNNLSALHDSPPYFATSTPMVPNTTKTPKSIIKKLIRTPKNHARK